MATRSAYRRIRIALLVVTASAVLAACGGEDAPVLDCVHGGYPCSWAEVDPDVVRRTDITGRLAARLMQEVRSTERVAAFLEGAPGMAEVQSGDLAVRFRLHGGRPGWVMVPVDPERPRLGGGPATAPPGDWLPSGEEGSGIAAETTGEGKKALVVSPFEWQWPGKTSDVVDVLMSSRDYGAEHGGSVTYHANLQENAVNPQGPVDPRDDSEGARTMRRAPGAVSLDDFRHWDKFNFVYLSTHGAQVCKDGRCHTVLSAGQAMDGAAQLALEHPRTPGVDPLYTSSNLHPGLSDTEVDKCMGLLQGEGKDHRTAPAPAGKPCLHEERKDYAVLLLSTDFFRDAYRQGLDNVVVFLAACQSLKQGDLADVFIRPQNRNVAVLGYDEVVYTDRAAEIGALVARVMTADDGPAMDNQAVIDHVKAHKEFASEPFDGKAQGDEDLPGRPARFVEGASNPTHARDVVELLDPATGEELADGGSVATADTNGDGKADGIRIGMRVRGIRDRDSAKAIAVYLDVDGHQVAGPFQPTRRVEAGVFDVAEREIALGFDPGTRQTMDLAIRAELAGGGDSRWSYDDIRVGSGFSYQAEGDLRVRGEGPFPGVIAVSQPPTGDCVIHLPFHVPGMDHSLRLAARLPQGLREGRYEVAKSFLGNPDTPFGSLDYDFRRIWITSSPGGEHLTPGVFHAEMGADKRHGSDDRGASFVSREGTVTVESFDRKRLELAFSVDLVQVEAEGPFASQLSADDERLLESGYPFHSDLAKQAGRQRVRETRAAYERNPPRRTTRVTGRLSHVISGGLSPPDIYMCKQPAG